MIPDKIYLPKEEIEERMPWIATPYEDDPNWDECYIRKDALLEWVKEQAKHFSARSDELEVIDPTNPDVIFFDGKHAAFTEMIKRIELL